MFQSVDDVITGFGSQKYLCNKSVATVVYLGTTMQKPILVEGPAGVGKTELGKVLADALGMNLIRLQCYEGLDEAKALYEWEYAKQLLYTQILKEKIGDILQGTRTLQEAVDCVANQDGVFFSDRFLLPRPLLKALLSDERCVLLIDEIDKSDAEFEAFLLEVLSDFQISVPEIGTLKAKHVPLVILTSNNSREMSDALKRRCLHLYIDFPESEREMEIIKLKVPGRGKSVGGGGRAPAAPAAQVGSQENAEYQRDSRLGSRIDFAQYQAARSRFGQRNAFDIDEVRSGHS